MFGRPGLLALRDRVARGELPGPRIYAVGIDEECPNEQPLAACLTAMKVAGIIMVKIYWDDRPRFDSIVAIARQLHLPVGGHVSQWVGLGPSLAVPYATVEHLWGYFEYLVGTRPRLMTDLAVLMGGNAPPLTDSAAFRDTIQALVDTASWLRPGWRLDPRKLQAVAAATRRAGTWNAPTLVIEESWCWQPRPAGASTPSGQLGGKIYEVKFALVKALQDAGAGLLLSTDDVAGFAVHRELELLVGVAGLTPYQALATGTRNVARYLGTEDSTGTVAVGKRADLVLLAGNPLRDIRYTAGPAGVMVGGRWLARADLERGLDSIVAAGGGLRDLSRLRQAALQHQGTQLNVWPDSTPLPASGDTGDLCQRVRAAGR
jgi:hypothetical protein